jgi:hypothetical protein
MRILLAYFAQFAWLLYAACGLGAIVYAARALSLQRRRGASLTSFELEASSHQIARSWRLSVIFVLVGVALFLAQAYVLPRTPLEALLLPTPTASGLAMPTESPTATPTLLAGVLPTIETTPLPESSPITTTLIPTATPEPTETPEPVPSMAMNVRLGDVAELVGYDIAASEVSTSGGAGVILYWRALDGAAVADYWVFTHLRSPDGLLIAQHDGAPVGGTRPTAGWVAGELVVDYHQLLFTEESAGYTGPAQVAVGLYDPARPEVRVLLADGSDYVTLPSTLNVIGP